MRQALPLPFVVQPLRVSSLRNEDTLKGWTTNKIPHRRSNVPFSAQIPLRPPRLHVLLHLQNFASLRELGGFAVQTLPIRIGVGTLAALECLHCATKTPSRVGLRTRFRIEDRMSPPPQPPSATSPPPRFASLKKLCVPSRTRRLCGSDSSRTLKSRDFHPIPSSQDPRFAFALHRHPG